MTHTLRVLDTGVMEGRLNIALGQAIVEARQSGEVPDTLRFLRFPPTALVGRHQALAQEINLPFCAENDIGVVRRITGGGAIFLDPGQLGWELAMNRSTLGAATLPELTRKICEAAAEGISSLGVEARYRPRNDIEIGGRKVSGTGGFFDGDTLFFQGTVLVDMNPGLMVQALRVPGSKLDRKDAEAARQRVVTLSELMGEETPALEQIQQALVNAFCDRFNLQAQPSEPGDGELAAARQVYDEEIGQDEFVRSIDEPEQALGVLSGMQTCPGGTIRCYLRLEGPRQDRIREVLFTGDYFVTPPRIIYDLESSLRGLTIKEAPETLVRFFRDAGIEVLSVSPEDFLQAFNEAADTL